MRCNCGIDPKHLTDQWLIAEQCELLMITGNLLKRNYISNRDIPLKLQLGKGHMKFWYNKLFYLNNRHREVKNEVKLRGFKVTDKIIDLSQFPLRLCNDWSPTQRDQDILKQRLLWKLINKPDIWRKNSAPIILNDFYDVLKHSLLYFV